MCNKTFFFLQTYAEMDPTTAALEKEHEAVGGAMFAYLSLKKIAMIVMLSISKALNNKMLICFLKMSQCFYFIIFRSQKLNMWTKSRLGTLRLMRGTFRHSLKTMENSPSFGSANTA